MNKGEITPSGRSQYWIREGEKLVADRERRLRRTRSWKFDTIATHGLYDLQQACGAHSASLMEPVYLSPAQVFRDYHELETALAYRMPAWTYSRIANPSSAFLGDTVALLETYGTGLEASCLVCSSGMAAIRSAIEPFLVREPALPPPNFVSTAQVYGGTFQQFSERQMADRGIEVRWVTDNLDLEKWAALIDPGTRFLFGEMPSNPAVALFDIAEVAALAHSHGIPLLVDATCASPALLRPLAFGADISLQSASKIMAASGTAIIGTLTARKDLVSRVGPAELRADFADWVRRLPFRDNGPAVSPLNAIMTLNDLRSLRSRAAQTSRTALQVARYLEQHPRVTGVQYPGLESHPQAALADKYLTLVDSDPENPEHCYGFMMTFEVAERDPSQPHNTQKFYNALDLIWRATDLGRVKTIATIPAISTHQQQGEEGRRLAGIRPNCVRLSIGIEHPDDLIADLEQALGKL